MINKIDRTKLPDSLGETDIARLTHLGNPLIGFEFYCDNCGDWFEKSIDDVGRNPKSCQCPSCDDDDNVTITREIYLSN